VVVGLVVAEVAGAWAGGVAGVLVQAAGSSATATISQQARQGPIQPGDQPAKVLAARIGRSIERARTVCDSLLPTS
jgi:hypothetical protein